MMKSSKAKCKVLPTGCGKHQNRLDDDWIENNPVEKNIGVLVDKETNMRQ